MKNKETTKDTKKGIIKKYVKLRTLIIIVVLLAFNSYAWFVFATKVSTGLTAHVTSWEVTFVVGEDESTTEIVLDVGKLYPGMETYTKEIKAQNKGESKAKLSYIYDSLTVLGQKYSVGDGYTQEELNNIIENNFPFKIKVAINNDNLESQDGYGLFIITIEWPYESGDDELDTFWGQQAYSYYEANPDEAGLKLHLTLIAQQQV